MIKQLTTDHPYKRKYRDFQKKVKFFAKKTTIHIIKKHNLKKTMTKITIKDNSGIVAANFTATTDLSIGTQAQSNGAAIPFSCGIGACRACVGKVTKGKEFINEEAIGPKHIATESDEILTCIAGVKENQPQDAEIEIECENL